MNEQNPLDEVIPHEAQMDPWLVFHGTSNIYEESISTNGLCPGTSSFDLSELMQVESIFDRLHWDGIHPGGIAILKPFSINHDFSHEDEKPIFIAPSAHFASLFATSDFAGGEICRSLYYCIADLHKYLEDEKIREKHVRKLEMISEQSRIDRPAIPTLDWVRSNVGQLSELKAKVEKIRASFCYGVIYAIRLDVTNLADINFHTFMGIKSFRSIQESEIETKYNLPAHFKYRPFYEDEKRNEAIFVPGVVKKLYDRGSVNKVG